MHDHDHAHGRERNALTFALSTNGVFLVVELVGGLTLGSLALIADAAHMVSDVAALTIALIAQRLATRPATARHTFGLQRAEVLGALANAVLLLASCGWITVEALRRFDEPKTIGGAGLLAIATIGLIVNVVSAVVLHRSAQDNINIRGAMMHMTLDAAGSVAAIVAGISVLAFDAAWVDPAASLVIVVLVLFGAFTLLREATQILMEGTPKGLDADEIGSFIADDPGVESVHHVHVWNIASKVPALSAHVVIAGEVSLHDAQIEANRLRSAIHDRFGIEHSTFELECHACE